MRHFGIRTPSITPGVCARVNGRWLAVAGCRDGELDFVLPSNHALHDEKISEIEFPIGRGFPTSHLTVPSVIAVAGGTGLGAIVNLVEQRAAVGLETHVIFYGRNCKHGQVLDAFPALKRATTFGCWDTVRQGRPTSPLNPLWPGEEPIVFFAGPKSLLAALEVDPRRPKIIQNF